MAHQTNSTVKSVEKELVEIATRIRNEVQIAMQNWATVEAFNNSQDKIEVALTEAGGWAPAILLVRALARDVLMTLMRITDDPHKDRQTLLRFRKLWEDTNNVSLSDCITVHRKALFDNVPRKWTDEKSLKTQLGELRTNFKDVRDNLIAHALPYSTLNLKNDVVKIRPFLLLISGLSNHAAMMAGFKEDDLQLRWDRSLDESRRFWATIVTST